MSLAGGTAVASTVRVDREVDEGASFFTLVVEGRSGERNRVDVSVRRGQGTVVTDRAGVTPGRGCRRRRGTSTAAVCSLRGDSASLEVRLGDRADRARIGPVTRDDFDGGVQLDGGSGNDVLIAGRIGASFTGGPGDDRMVGGPLDDSFNEGRSRSGSDTFFAGGAEDVVSYRERRQPVRANLNGRRDDGEAGERDRIVGALNQLVGGEGADRLAGDRRTNHLEGNGGSDTLLGSGGHDFLFGGDGRDDVAGGSGLDKLHLGPGDDVARAVDGHPDYISCDGATSDDDSVALDGFDFFANTDLLSFPGDPAQRDMCERISRRGTPSLVFVPDIDVGVIDVIRQSYSVPVGCPSDGPPRCAGEVRVLAGKRVLGRKHVQVSNGETYMSDSVRTGVRVRRGRRLAGTVIVRFRGASGQLLERRTRVTIAFR